ncbi:MAG: tRNA (N6-isopentenyl adenosine(37)-C2)-methylthiotransferase MiaB [Nitrospiraceae bacterium]|nr:tRNA (N6-isopentenyl adenosine(37)-C2)-methylthiotransferase MiaB [Nitrospiraceae bacterium]
MEKSVYIYTYGCQMNVHDSEKMIGLLSENGYKEAGTPAEADLIIFNTCAIREKAEQKFYSQLGRIKTLKKKKKDLVIAVAGCVAQEMQKKVFTRAPHVDFIFGPQNIGLLPDLLKRGQKMSVDINPALAGEEFTAERGSRTRAWVSIMYGCNNFCSYCIVPYTRGREVSRPPSSIVAEIRDLKARGYREVTLLGQNVNSYRSDTDFKGLLRLVASVGLDRVRFVTSHPRDLTADLVDAIAELPCLCEHIHLPLQSGSDRILRAMNRGYDYADYRKKIDMLRERVPGIAITSDIIVGFPGESDEDYLETLHALESIQYDGLFAFKYSKRRGTKAYSLEDQVPEIVKTTRLNRLLKLQDEMTLKKNLAYENGIVEILVEGRSETDEGRLCGRTRSNKIVTIQDNGDTEGDLVKVLIMKARMHSLEGIRTDKQAQATRF